MTLLNPAGLLLLLTIPAIVLFHLFRQERRRHEVSSIFLWQQISEQQSRRVRPRLLRNVNLLLQILAASVASLALAQPVLVTSAGESSPRTIVLVDTSASMAASDGQVSRLDLAKNRAREIVGRLRRDTEVLVATVAPRPSIVGGFTTDRADVYDAIRNLTVVDGPADLGRAVALIRGLGETNNSEIVFVTDAAFDADPTVVLPRRFRTEQVGTPVANRAITTFRLRPRLDRTTLEAYIEVGDFSSEPATVAVGIGIDGRLISRDSLTLTAGELRRVAVTLPATEGSVFSARLVGNEDALPTDDLVYAVARSVRPLRVQMVGTGDYFLEALLAVYPDIALTVTPTLDRTIGTDLYVIDGVDVPYGLTGSVLVLNTAVPGGPFTPIDRQSPDRKIAVNRSHPIADGVDLSDVTIREALRGTLSERATIVASAGDLPILYTATWNGVRLVGANFSLADSDLPLRSCFPVLMSNIISWLAPSPQENEISSVPAGTVVSLLVTPGAPFVVTDPSGSSREFLVRDNTALFTDTTKAGIYTITGAGFSDLFAVSLSSAEESNLTPRFAADIAAESPESTAGSAPGRPVWFILAAVAALVLAADWIVWARRT